MSALNLTNMKTGVFNDIYMIKNTGRTSIYDLFGNTENMVSSQTLNSKLLNYASQSSLLALSDVVSQIQTGYATLPYVNSINGSLTTSISNLNTNINTTFGSYLRTSLFNTTASSFLPLTTYNNTISSMLVLNTNNISSLTNITNNISYNSVSGITNINNDIVSTTTASTKRLTIESTNAGGTPYLYFKCRNNFTSSLYLGGFGFYISAAESSNLPIQFMVNDGTTTLTPLKINGNGVVHVGNNIINNKQLVLFENASGDAPNTATNFGGLGTQSGGSMRYQVPTATSTHRFFCGSVQSFFISNGTGASGSDVRFKSEILNITDALNKVNNLQGKTFKYQNSDKRQMGFLAQELINIIPEVVYEDQSDENNYLYVAYDRIVSLLTEAVKELNLEVQQLKTRINILESK